MIYWTKKFFSDLETHSSVAAEVIIVVFFLIAPFLSLYVKENAFQHQSTVFANGLLSKGQVFVLIWGLAGSILYLAFASKPRNAPKTFFGFACLFILVPVIFMSGFDPAFSTTINEDVNRWGHYAFIFFVLSYYVLLFFENLEPPSPEISLKEGADQMAQAAREL